MGIREYLFVWIYLDEYLIWNVSDSKRTFLFFASLYHIDVVILYLPTTLLPMSTQPFISILSYQLKRSIAVHAIKKYFNR